MTEDPWEAMVSHADRYWNAEEENARRLTRRGNLVLAIIAGLLGLGPLQIFVDPQTTTDLIWPLFLLLPVFFLIRSGLFILGILSPKAADDPSDDDDSGEELANDSDFIASSASSLLQIPDQVESSFKRPRSGTAPFARMQIYAATIQASENLRVRNARRKDQIDAAQQELIIAVALILSTLSVYLLFTFLDSLPPEVWENIQQLVDETKKSIQSR